MRIIENPDYVIKIGVKDNEVIFINWGNKFGEKYDDAKLVFKEIKKMLNKARKMI